MGRRRAARNVVSYNMKEYDNIMKTAIDDGKVKYSAEEMAGYVAAGTQVCRCALHALHGLLRDRIVQILSLIWAPD